MPTIDEARSHVALQSMARDMHRLADSVVTMVSRTVITEDHLMVEAAGLLDPTAPHANPEYVRALVELICRATGKTEVDKPRVQSSLIHLVTG